MGKANFVLAIVIAVLFSLACGFMLWSGYGIWALAAYAGIIVCFPLQYVFHELGHVVFGAICKIKVIPEFSFFRSDRCKILPKTDKRLKPRIVITSLGGLIVNLILGIFGFLAFSKLIPLWLCVFLPSSAYILEINANRTNGASGKTDMDICFELLSGSDEGKVLLAVLTVQAQLNCGKRITEIDEALLFNVPQIREDDESFIALTELRYEYVKARDGEETAKPYKDRFEMLKEYLS